MVDLLLFEREEVQFIHDDVEFIYNFHRFDTGKITFKRLDPTAPIQGAEEVIYPAGKPHLANMAIIVLYKASASGQMMSGFLPNVLRTMLELNPSKEVTKNNLANAILSFNVKNPIASIEQVIKFVEPYASWAVYSPKRSIVDCRMPETNLSNQPQVQVNKIPPISKLHQLSFLHRRFLLRHPFSSR
jgi:hypothetical protein